MKTYIPKDIPSIKACQFPANGGVQEAIDLFKWVRDVIGPSNVTMSVDTGVIGITQDENLLLVEPGDWLILDYVQANEQDLLFSKPEFSIMLSDEFNLTYRELVQ